MALFRNLTFDLGILNKIKKKPKDSRPVLQNPPTPPIEIRELPDVSKKLVEEASSKEPSQLPILKKPTIPPKINRVENLDNDSFFNSLYRHISKEERFLHSNIPKELMNKNLFDEMRAYWEDRRDLMRNVKISKAIKEDLTYKIQELQLRELEWQRLKLQYEKISDELASKEIMIDNNIRDLKRAFKRAHLHTNIKPEHQFVRASGDKIKNLQSLIDTMRTMQSDEFGTHVNENKNDFATWVNDVLGLSKLSQNLRKAETKEQMLDILETWSLS